jgi:hypothetical protein
LALLRQLRTISAGVQAVAVWRLLGQALCLNLFTNAVITWNTVHMTEALDTLRNNGGPVSDDDLVHLAPTLRAHINGTESTGRHGASGIPSAHAETDQAACEDRSPKPQLCCGAASLTNRATGRSK